MSKPGKKYDKTNNKSDIPILGKKLYEASTPALYNTKYKVICPVCGEEIIFTVYEKSKMIICNKCSAPIHVNAVEKNANEDPKTIYNQDPEDSETDDIIPGDKKEDTNYRYDNHDDEPASTPGNNLTNEGTNYQEQKQNEDPETIYDHNRPDERTNLKEQKQKEEPPTKYAYGNANKGDNANRQQQNDNANEGYNVNHQKQGQRAPRQQRPSQERYNNGGRQNPPVETPPKRGSILNMQPESDAKLVWWSLLWRRKYILRMGKNYIGRRDKEYQSDLSLRDKYASARSICIEVTKKYSNRGIETYEYRLTVEKARNSVLYCGREVREGTTIDLTFGDTIVLGKTTLTLKPVKK